MFMCSLRLKKEDINLDIDNASTDYHYLCVESVRRRKTYIIDNPNIVHQNVCVDSD